MNKVNNNQYITATDIMNYLYDPRSIYFMHVLKIPQEITCKMEEGRKIHDFLSKSKRNKLIKELPKLDKKYDVYLTSHTLNCATRIDCILFDKKLKKAYPVEFKFSRYPKRLYNRQKYQLVLEAMLIEEIYGYKVNYGYLKFMIDNVLIKIFITEELKNNLLNIINNIKNIIENEKLPNVRGINQRLKDYGYRNIM